MNTVVVRPDTAVFVDSGLRRNDDRLASHHARS
jgi:hypothetical protein